MFSADFRDPEVKFFDIMKLSAVWSSGMIPALGAGGPGFDSRNSPFLFAARAHSCTQIQRQRDELCAREACKSPATRNRTRDHLIYSQMLYQLSYRRLKGV